jgi:hypothetical protein
MESAAVLSDIHGVLPALDAVLAQPAVRGTDRIVPTGDIAPGRSRATSGASGPRTTPRLSAARATSSTPGSWAAWVRRRPA